MEKDSRKNQKIHKNVGLFKSTIERKTRIKIREKENRLGRSLTREEKAKLRHKVTHDFQTQLAVRIGAVSLIGLTFFSAGKMLNEGSGRIEGVSQENDNSVTIQANNFREGLKVVGLGDEGILIVQDENGKSDLISLKINVLNKTIDNKQISFIEKIVDFFTKVINWLNSIFNSIIQWIKSLF